MERETNNIQRDIIIQCSKIKTNVCTMIYTASISILIYIYKKYKIIVLFV